MKLTITPEVEALLQQHLQSGRFQNSNDVIVTALHVLSGTTQDDIAGLEAAIAEGIEAADRGELYTESEARAYLRAVREKL